MENKTVVENCLEQAQEILEKIEFHILSLEKQIAIIKSVTPKKSQKDNIITKEDYD